MNKRPSWSNITKSQPIMWQIKAKSGHILSTQVTNLSQHPSCTLLRPKRISTWPVFKALKLKSTHRLNYVTIQRKMWSHFKYPGYLFILAMWTVFKAIMVKSTHRWDQNRRILCTNHDFCWRSVDKQVRWQIFGFGWLKRLLHLSFLQQSAATYNSPSSIVT